MDENEMLDREMAFARQHCWSDTCDDLYDPHIECRRRSGHDGRHAAGFGKNRVRW